MNEKITTLKPSDIKYQSLPLLKNFLKSNKVVLQIQLQGKDRYQGLPIHFAVIYGKLPLIQWMLKADPQLLNATDDHHLTPLALAAKHNHFEILKYLLTQEAKHDIPAHFPETPMHEFLPIHWACYYGHSQLVSFFLARTKNIDLDTDKHQHALIHIATQQGHLDIVKCLLAHYPSLLHLVDTTLLNTAALYKQQTIIEFFLNETPLSKNPWELMLIALFNCNLDMMKLLTTRYPEIPHMKNSDGESPLRIAVQHHNRLFVNYLLTQNVNVDDVSTREMHWGYNKTALEQAMSLEFYDIACDIILKKTENQPSTAILPFITHIDMVIFFLRQDASLIQLFKANERINLLIDAYLKNANQKNLIVYTRCTMTRQPSFFQHIDLTSGEINIFSPVRRLGEGFFGRVRLFEDVSHTKQIAVKSSYIISADPVLIDEETQKRAKENMMNVIAYPHHTSSSLFSFPTQKSHLHTKVVYRQILPYLEGENAADVITRTKNLDNLGQLILCIAKELQRLHDAGMIHGDVHFNNVLIHQRSDGEIVAHSIDFGSSCLTKDMERTESINAFNSEASNIEQNKVTSNPDILMFGRALKSHIRRRTDWKKFKTHFPSVDIFIKASQDINQNPSLISFCTDLENELRAHTEAQKKTSEFSLAENTMPDEQAPSF